MRMSMLFLGALALSACANFQAPEIPWLTPGPRLPPPTYTITTKNGAAVPFYFRHDAAPIERVLSEAFLNTVEACEGQAGVTGLLRGDSFYVAGKEWPADTDVNGKVVSWYKGYTYPGSTAIARFPSVTGTFLIAIHELGFHRAAMILHQDPGDNESVEEHPLNASRQKALERCVFPEGIPASVLHEAPPEKSTDPDYNYIE